LFFAQLPQAINQPKTKSRTAVTRSGWAASGVKCKWAWAVAKQLQKNEGGDTDFPCRKCNEAGTSITNHHGQRLFCSCFKAGSFAVLRSAA